MRTIISILILSFCFSVFGQVETINNYETKANFVNKINTNKSLFQNYINRTLGVSNFPSEFGSSDIYDLNDLFDTLDNRLGFNSDIDSIYYGARGRILRNAINDNFSSLETDVSNGNNSWFHINAASLTDSVQVEALKYLYFALIDSSLSAKMHAVYPIVGGSADAHKYNLDSPYDADSSYRLTFGGTITHDSLGLKGNGSTGYGNTHYTLTDTANIHVSIYSLTDSVELQDVDVGATSDASNYFNFSSGYDGYFYLNTQETAHTNTSVYNNNSKGHYTVTVNDTVVSTFIEGVKVSMTKNDLTVVPSDPLYISAQNHYALGTYQASLKKLSLVTIGDYLTDAESYRLSSIVRKYQSMLQRSDTVTGRYIGRETSAYPISLVELGYDAVPATARTARLAEWMAYDRGVIIDYNGRTYYTEIFQGLTHSPYKLKPDTTHIDVSQWLSVPDSLGVDYAVFTIFEATGYSLTPTDIPFPERLIDKFGGYTKYDTEVNPWLDTSLFRAFIDTCEVYGIEPVPYVNPMRNFNLQDNTAFAHLAWDSTDCVHYNNWLAAYIQELMTNYDFRYIWIDGWKGNELDTEGTGMVTDFQLIYNSVKAIDTSCLVIMNELTDTSFIRFPYDIGSSEEAVMDAGGFTDSELADTIRYHNGTAYFVPKEFIMTPRLAARWYAEGLEVPESQLRSVADIQAFYDRAKAVGVTFNFAVLPGPSGVVSEPQWDIWRNIDWDSVGYSLLGTSDSKALVTNDGRNLKIK